MRDRLVTLNRAAWNDIACHVTAKPDQEVFGYLIGRFTRLGARVHHAMHEPRATGDGEHVWLDEGKDEAESEQRIVREYAPLECVGRWHSHVFSLACVAALLPQLSDSDEQTTALGSVEMICCVFPMPDDQDIATTLSKKTEFALARQEKNLCCRAEAWLRVRKGKIMPCRVKVR